MANPAQKVVPGNGIGWLQFPSIEARLETTDHRPSGFDYLRIILAVLIVGDHTIIACQGMDAQRDLFSGMTRPLLIVLVPMFFALSGFLVAGSLLRTRSLVTFAGLRVLRIVPALAVDTLFCALILGVLFTNEPLSNYFRSSELHKYFLNIAGDIHYTLPGVFARNPSNVVNAQLWTIPFELKCYVALTAMAVIGLHRRRLLFLATTILITLLTMAYVTRYPVEITDVWQMLIPSFLFGVCAFVYRDRLQWNPWLFGACLIATGALLTQNNALMVLGSLPVAYLTIWLGLLNSKRDALIRSGDYSYSLYLYSFPIQQAIIAITPWGRLWWANFLLALPLTFALAAFSWHVIEKPAQSQRSHLYAFDAWLRARLHRFLKRGQVATPRADADDSVVQS